MRPRSRLRFRGADYTAKRPPTLQEELQGAGIVCESPTIHWELPGLPRSPFLDN